MGRVLFIGEFFDNSLGLFCLSFLTCFFVVDLIDPFEHGCCLLFNKSDQGRIGCAESVESLGLTVFLLPLVDALANLLNGLMPYGDGFQNLLFS